MYLIAYICIHSNCHLFSFNAYYYTIKLLVLWAFMTLKKFCRKNEITHIGTRNNVNDLWRKYHHIKLYAHGTINLELYLLKFFFSPTKWQTTVKCRKISHCYQVFNLRVKCCREPSKENKKKETLSTKQKKVLIN